MSLMYGLGAMKPILAIFCTWTPCLGTKLCPNELIFHAHIEENSTDHLCIREKKMVLSIWLREILKIRFLALQ